MTANGVILRHVTQCLIQYWLMLPYHVTALRQSVIALFSGAILMGFTRPPLRAESEEGAGAPGKARLAQSQPKTEFLDINDVILAFPLSFQS